MAIFAVCKLQLFPGADNLVLYGPTETSVMVTCYAVPPSAPQGLLGQPTANSHLYVVFPGQPGSLVPIGAPGELLISGPGLADGYINLPDPAKTSFIDNPFYAEVRFERIMWLHIARCDAKSFLCFAQCFIDLLAGRLSWWLVR